MAPTKRAQAAVKKMAPVANPYRRSLLRQERSRQTREKLVRAALMLWRTKGFDETTVEEISAEAGVGWSTFYYHFPSKDDLLQELARLTASLADADAAGPPTGSLQTDVERFVAALSGRVQRAPRQIAEASLRRMMPGIALLGGDADNGDEASFSHTIQRLLDRAVVSGELPAGTDTAELGALGCAMLMEGLLRWAAGSASSTELETVLRLRTTIFLAGIGAGARGQ